MIIAYCQMNKIYRLKIYKPNKSTVFKYVMIMLNLDRSTQYKLNIITCKQKTADFELNKLNVPYSPRPANWKMDIAFENWYCFNQYLSCVLQYFIWLYIYWAWENVILFVFLWYLWQFKSILISTTSQSRHKGDRPSPVTKETVSVPSQRRPSQSRHKGDRPSPVTKETVPVPSQRRPSQSHHKGDRPSPVTKETVPVPSQRRPSQSRHKGDCPSPFATSKSRSYYLCICWDDNVPLLLRQLC